MFKARTGVFLRTKKYRARYQDMDTLCGEEEETAEHLVLYCKGLHPAVAEGETDLVKALGFQNSEGIRDLKMVEIIKRRLADWWHKSRDG